MAPKWTFNEVRTLKGCVRDGMFYHEIADIHLKGRGLSAIRTKARRLGLKHPSMGKGSIDGVNRSRLLRYLTENPGATITDAARALGRTRPPTNVMARLLAADGFLSRTGGKRGRGVRYVPVSPWTPHDTTDKMRR